MCTGLIPDTRWAILTRSLPTKPASSARPLHYPLHPRQRQGRRSSGDLFRSARLTECTRPVTNSHYFMTGDKPYRSYHAGPACADPVRGGCAQRYRVGPVQAAAPNASLFDTTERMVSEQRPELRSERCGKRSHLRHTRRRLCLPESTWQREGQYQPWR